LAKPTLRLLHFLVAVSGLSVKFSGFTANMALFETLSAVFLREGGRQLHTCVHRAAFIRGQRYSILPALTSDGIIALDIFEGSVNKEKFIRFLKEDLVCTLHFFV
jgi:hypothetical protein